MPIEEIDHVQLAMPQGQEDEARSFYGELLEMSEVPKPGEMAKRGGAWFEVGTVKVHLGVEENFRAAKKAHPAFLVSDIDALAHRLAAAGHATHFDTELPGIKRFFAYDPFGNRLEFMEAES